MNILVNKFCNLIMRSGNKTKALALFSQGFTIFLQSTKLSLAKQSKGGLKATRNKNKSLTLQPQERKKLNKILPNQRSTLQSEKPLSLPLPTQHHEMMGPLLPLAMKAIEKKRLLKKKHTKVSKENITTQDKARLQESVKIYERLAFSDQSLLRKKVSYKESTTLLGDNSKVSEVALFHNATTEQLQSLVTKQPLQPLLKAKQGSAHFACKAAHGKEAIFGTNCSEKRANFLLLDKLIENIRPCLEIRKVRVAKATYLVPAQINKSKGQTLALRWIIEFAKKRRLQQNLSFPIALAQELKLAHEKQGSARQRRSELHRLAEANRANIAYRWW